ncbi:MAG: hypothetical protein ACOYOB_20625 [Myxococcota bacterium]
MSSQDVGVRALLAASAGLAMLVAGCSNAGPSGSNGFPALAAGTSCSVDDSRACGLADNAPAVLICGGGLWQSIEACVAGTYCTSAGGTPTCVTPSSSTDADVIGGSDVSDGSPDTQEPANCNKPADCDDGNPCTVDACALTKCTHSPAEAGTACGTGKLCDSLGSCATQVPLVCGPNTPVPTEVDPTGAVFRVSKLHMDRPDSETGYVSTQLNAMWSTAIQQKQMNVLIKLQAWLPAQKKATVSIGTGSWNETANTYSWDGIPALLDVEVDNPRIKTPGQHGVGQLSIKPSAFSQPLRVTDLAMQAKLACDASGILGGALQGSIKREDAKAILVKFPIASTVNEIGLVNFLELAYVFTDKATQLADNAGIAAPCPFTADLTDAAVPDGWCIPKKGTAFWDKDCAVMLGCSKGAPQNDADDQRCAVEVKDNAVVKTICVQPDAWHFVATFAAERISNVQ